MLTRRTLISSFVSLAQLVFFPFVRDTNAVDIQQTQKQNQKNIVIFSNKKCQAVIIVDSQHSPEVSKAAQLLASYFQKSTGAVLPISEEPLEDQSVRIYIGLSGYVKTQNLSMLGLDDDGFIITFPDHNNIIIVGPTDWGTEFGVYEFLERYLGISWLFPGEDGEFIPNHTEIHVAPQNIRQAPAFLSRHLSGLRGKAQATWARRHRMHGSIVFHHNLSKLFPPAKYTKTHPEFFPFHDKKRYLPSDNETGGWQPCFSAPGIVDEAIKNILLYFAQYPEASSYSLGVNDRGGFCNCTECTAKYGNRKNFLGYRDYSDQYFEWANAVVAGVVQKFPDKWFGCLAYRELAQPPSQVIVHPRIIPYLTEDRMKWVDVGIRNISKRSNKAWQKKTSSLGWYDYIYGTPYCLPRIYFHEMLDYYRYGYTEKTRAMYAEAYPNWGEGPKLYVALKLQWNPNLNLDALLKDWYEKAVGVDAAIFLEEYYRIWEHFWTSTILSSPWFKRSTKSIYLPFKNPSYLMTITDEIAKSRRLLEKVISKTKTDAQARRAKIILRAFEYYEASAVSYMAIHRQPNAPGYHQMVDQFRKKRLELVDSFETDEVLRHSTRFDRFDSLQW